MRTVLRYWLFYYYYYYGRAFLVFNVHVFPLSQSYQVLVMLCDQLLISVEDAHMPHMRQ